MKDSLFYLSSKYCKVHGLRYLKVNLVKCKITALLRSVTFPNTLAPVSTVAQFHLLSLICSWHSPIAMWAPWRMLSIIPGCLRQIERCVRTKPGILLQGRPTWAEDREVRPRALKIKLSKWFLVIKLFHYMRLVELSELWHNLKEN